MLQHPDFPPIPKCFSHLLVDNNVDSPGESQTHSIRLATDIAEFEQIGSPEDLDHLPLNSSKAKEAWTDPAREQREKFGYSSCENQSPVAKEPLTPQNAEANGQDVTEPKSPYLKLHSSLLKLQREMKDLRHLDISLFCQLLSLNEAIQDFKMTISDRYSETGSEYSLGTASYMGSMSSLNDESDWGEEGTLLNSFNDQQDGSEAGENTDENSQSASSLLKQITDLAQRADEDF